ncbi:hypothetical protein CEP54_012653 [Fusarium duplospermum]|uniref:Uncharacterized protein n=1 Tax=Fusarium duplospermum TaxID=1325734 RepID=A0A428P7E8_9HYPO|nr:hypothetical protein CEP54_012653 [Fusarium duplospermum]
MVKHTKKPYFLLNEPVALDDENDTLNRLLGLAVVDPYSPTTVAYTPDKPLRARDAIDDLYPSTPVICEDFKLVRSKTSEQKASAKLQSLVKFSLGHGDSKEEDFSAAVFRRFSMDNTIRRLEALLREPTEETPASEATHGADHEVSRKKQLEIRKKYREEVLDFLHRPGRGKLYIITGFITCIDLKKNLDTSRHSSAAVGAGTGPSALTGLPEAQLEAEYSRTHGFGVQGAYVGEYLIACSYFCLTAREGTKPGLFSWLMPKFGKDRNYAVGSEEMWRFGDKQVEGNTEALLGAETRSPSESVSSDEEGMAVELLYGDSDDESDDGFIEDGDDGYTDED